MMRWKVEARETRMGNIILVWPSHSQHIQPDHRHLLDNMHFVIFSTSLLVLSILSFVKHKYFLLILG